MLSWETVGGVGAPEAVAEALQSLGCKEREKHERKDPGGPATFGALTQRCECEAEAAVLGCSGVQERCLQGWEHGMWGLYQ